jgi:hypothetical protein
VNNESTPAKSENKMENKIAYISGLNMKRRGSQSPFQMVGKTIFAPLIKRSKFISNKSPNGVIPDAGNVIVFRHTLTIIGIINTKPPPKKQTILLAV